MRSDFPTARWLAWSWCLFVFALLVGGWAWMPALDSFPLLRVGAFAAAGLLMLGLVFLFPSTSDSKARRLILISAVLLRLVLWPAPVSDDVNRYLWEGRLVRDGGNPYSAPASDARWESRRDEVWHAMNHRDRATAYPPGSQWIMAGVSFLGDSPKSFKILALAGDLATLLLLLGILRDRGLPPRWAGFYAFNPAVLFAFAAEAHFDSLMIAALLAALVAQSKGKPSAWLWLGLAIQIKLAAVVLVPLFITRRLSIRILLLLGILVLPSLPFLSALPAWSAGVRQFADSSAFNAPAFSFLACIGIPLAVVRMICFALFFISATMICLARWREMPLIDAVVWMLGALLAFSPIVHFWYLCWLLPLTAIRPSLAWTTLSVTMGGYFIAWWTLAHHGWWGYGHAIALVIWVPWLIAGAAQNRILKARIRPWPCEPFGLSVVLPVLCVNDAVISLVNRMRRDLGSEAEILVVEAGSSNSNSSNSELLGARVIHSVRGRGEQIAAGVDASKAPWILIIHGDAIPPSGWLEALRKSIEAHLDASLLVFGQRFDSSGWKALVIEVLNEMRVVFGGVAFGDQIMVIRRRALLEAGGFPTQPLMEDVEVSMRLAGNGRVVYLGREWTVSASKWQRAFKKRVLLVFSLVASYQFARLRSRSCALELSKQMYREYYPELPPQP
jgi:Glycosyl transferase family 2